MEKLWKFTHFFYPQRFTVFLPAPPKNDINKLFFLEMKKVKKEERGREVYNTHTWQYKTPPNQPTWLSSAFEHTF